ncbi:mitochondrial nuclease [Volvox carteri f. nagariensis]|uniref:Endonuclease n=1 Tax=Volvox carteri f. nagariensis TaxID=3068 RepID=D8UF41_VOLCA|nr:mitochondrial nuclease [Volvox carteri f. nagariensis]EFJ41614.1 mitochondrial nuclease [Volvox carteri f. nagariensis]|eukprot:XP_002957270.1 mitochondrial nuclease [Volvox carteri f. nagariensis]
MRMLFVGFGVGVAVGAGGCYLYLSAVKQPQDRRAGLGISLVEGHHAAKFGAPETEIIRQYEGYVAAYDYRTRNPKWVLKHITRASSNGDAKREGSEFFPDPGIDPRFSAKLSDFRGSGYDRGHMTPAADHKSSQKAMDETFSLINISPQVGAGFNRDYWARFERFVKELTYAAADVYIVTGPLWLPTQSPPPQQQQQDGDGGGGGGGGGEASGKAKGGRWTLVHDWIGTAP